MVEGEPEGEAPARPPAPDGAPQSDSVQCAMDLAFRHLARRERTVAEVRAHLTAKGVADAEVEAAVVELAHLGYLDDAGYARRFAEDRRTLDGWGAERIARRLRAGGVDPGHVAAALASPALGDELEAALELLRRRLPEPPDSDRERQRALSLLVRRGYELELAHDALRAFARAG